jgi:hypothetical protein
VILKLTQTMNIANQRTHYTCIVVHMGQTGSSIHSWSANLYQRGSLQKGFEKWEPKTWAREMPDGHTSRRWKVGWVLIVSETAAATAVVEFAIASNSSPYPWNSKPE